VIAHLAKLIKYLMLDLVAPKIKKAE